MGDRRLRPVELPEAGIALAVPVAWEEAPADGDLVHVARQADAPWFRVNLTVAIDRSRPAASAQQAGRLLADALPGGRLVDAGDHPDDGWVLVVVHRAPAQDVVTTQRQLLLDGHTVAVSVTWAVEQETAWRGEVGEILDTVTRR